MHFNWLHCLLLDDHTEGKMIYVPMLFTKSYVKQKYRVAIAVPCNVICQQNRGTYFPLIAIHFNSTDNLTNSIGFVFHELINPSLPESRYRMLEVSGRN